MNLEVIENCSSKKKQSKKGFQFLSTGAPYKVDHAGILIPEDGSVRFSDDAIIQKGHYDRVANNYKLNIELPHTKEYYCYLNKRFLAALDANLGICAELCCGTALLLSMLCKYENYVGVDVSYSMLRMARELNQQENCSFIQADVTSLPFDSKSLDNVVMLGGIHHVNNRQALFSEINRILKPGGKFYFREPANDFFLWRGLRFLIYRCSSSLDFKTERPLIQKETMAQLSRAGFRINKYEHVGFLGFCFFMNSDVLIFNKAFKYVPFIKLVTKFFCLLDDVVVKLPFFKKIGLQVIGVAEKSSADMRDL